MPSQSAACICYSLFSVRYSLLLCYSLLHYSLLLARLERLLQFRGYKVHVRRKAFLNGGGAREVNR